MSVRWATEVDPTKAAALVERRFGAGVVWCLAWDRCSTRWLGDCRRDVHELTPASSRSQARAVWLQRRVVQATHPPWDLPTREPDRKRLMDETIIAHRDHGACGGAVGDLRKTLWSTCRRARGQAWTSSRGRRASTAINRLCLDRVHGSSTDRGGLKPCRSMAFECCPQSPPPLGILSTDLSSLLFLFFKPDLSPRSPSSSSSPIHRAHDHRRVRDHARALIDERTADRWAFVGRRSTLRRCSVDALNRPCGLDPKTGKQGRRPNQGPARERHGHAGAETRPNDLPWGGLQDPGRRRPEVDEQRPVPRAGREHAGWQGAPRRHRLRRHDHRRDPGRGDRTGPRLHQRQEPLRRREELGRDAAAPARVAQRLVRARGRSRPLQARRRHAVGLPRDEDPGGREVAQDPEVGAARSLREDRLLDVRRTRPA